MIQVVCDRCGKTKEVKGHNTAKGSNLGGRDTWYKVMDMHICGECFFNTSAGDLICDIDDDGAMKGVRKGEKEVE